MMNIEPQVTGGKPFGASGIRPAAWRIKDGAAQLGVSRSSIYKMATKGEIRLLKIGGRVVIPDAEIQRLASGGARIHDLGPRALAELLIEILSGCDALARIEKYAELDPAIVAAVGARDLPPEARTVR